MYKGKSSFLNDKNCKIMLRIDKINKFPGFVDLDHKKENYNKMFVYYKI